MRARIKRLMASFGRLAFIRRQQPDLTALHPFEADVSIGVPTAPWGGAAGGDFRTDRSLMLEATVFLPPKKLRY